MAFTPENKLEESLINWAENKADQSQFLNDLLAAELFLIHYGSKRSLAAPNHSDNEIMLSVSFTVQDGIPCIPIFSSLSRLRAFTHGKSSYYQMNARMFFSLTRGTDLCLNPESDFYLVLTANDIAVILAHES